jgi:DNA-binding NarL/FixJ family response regulator
MGSAVINHSKKTIMIIDDHDLMRRGLISYFTETGEWAILGEAGSIDEAVALCKALMAKNTAPDVVILDMNLNGQWGLDLMTPLKRFFAPKLPRVVVYTMYDDFTHVRASLRAGAAACVCKSRPAAELEKALEEALAGRLAFPPEQVSRLSTSFDLVLGLSRREKQVFDLVQRRTGDRRIAEELGISVRTVENKPWAALAGDRKGEYIADCDRDAVSVIRQRAGGRFELRLDLFPEPYTGNPRAKIIFLNLNPGVSADPEEDKRDMRKLKPFVFRNYTHEKQDYPFYPLDPKLQSTGAYRYWTHILEHPIRDAGAKLVAKNFCCIEYFPYHSRNYGVSKQVPSQAYNRRLIKKAIQRGALIIIARKRRVLTCQIPELAAHERAGKVLAIKNPRKIKITRNNLPGYDKVLDILRDVNKTKTKE